MSTSPSVQTPPQKAVTSPSAVLALNVESRIVAVTPASLCSPPACAPTSSEVDSEALTALPLTMLFADRERPGDGEDASAVRLSAVWRRHLCVVGGDDAVAQGEVPEGAVDDAAAVGLARETAGRVGMVRRHEDILERQVPVVRDAASRRSFAVDGFRRCYAVVADDRVANRHGRTRRGPGSPRDVDTAPRASDGGRFPTVVPSVTVTPSIVTAAAPAMPIVSTGPPPEITVASSRAPTSLMLVSTTTPPANVPAPIVTMSPSCAASRAAWMVEKQPGLLPTQRGLAAVGAAAARC
jgi:hypothetical protein